MQIDDLLTERKARYGDFRSDATTAQILKDALRFSKRWYRLKPWHKEALEHICTKMSRIVNGDPDYTDNYSDIQGYARLVESIIKAEADD